MCRNVARLARRLTGIGVRQHENERLDIAQHLRFEPHAFGRQSDMVKQAGPGTAGACSRNQRSP
jgi:hypothetical protein